MKALIYFSIYAVRAHEVGPKVQRLEPGGKIPPLIENISFCNISTIQLKKQGKLGCKKFINLLLQTGLPPYVWLLQINDPKSNAYAIVFRTSLDARK